MRSVGPKILLLIGVYLSGLIAACGQQNPQPSSSQYIAWSLPYIQQSTISAAKEDAIHICLEGSLSRADLERVKTWSRRALLTWIRALVVIDEEVTGNIRFTCTNRDITFHIRSGNGVSFASPAVSTIYLNRPYGTWSHEVGHAFSALHDTYTGISAGDCQSGHPDSLMCWGAYGPRRNPEEWSTLWPDDIAGVQANFRRIFNVGQAPDWAPGYDLEAPLDLEEPWPGADLWVDEADIEGRLQIFETGIATKIVADVGEDR